jgi:hypothetical protein
VGHNITGMILPGPCDRHAVTEWDAAEVPLGAGLSLVHLTHYYTAYWHVGGVRDSNHALRVLGVRAVAGADEFDTVGLGRHRRTPACLDRYEDLCDDLGR